MKVWFTARARRRALHVASWWRANRPAAPDLFEQELHEAKQALGAHPLLGTVYKTVGSWVIRRVLLRESEQHVYYSVNESAETVVVHTLWGARRGRGPKL